MKLFFSIAVVVFFSQISSSTTEDFGSFMKSKGYIEIPLKKNAVGHFEIEGEINGVKGIFTLDTGASSTVLDTQRSEKFRLSKSIKEASAGGLGTSKQAAQIKQAKILKFGGYSIKRKQVAVVDLSAMNKALTSQGVRPQDGVIGGDILTNGEGVIDYKRNRLFMRK